MTLPATLRGQHNPAPVEDRRVLDPKGPTMKLADHVQVTIYVSNLGLMDALHWAGFCAIWKVLADYMRTAHGVMHAMQDVEDRLKEHCAR